MLTATHAIISSKQALHFGKICGATGLLSGEFEDENRPNQRN